MRPALNWEEYELIDATKGERLERWGNTILVRPDPQVIWNTPRNSIYWDKADAVYHRSSSGGGRWEYINSVPKEWTISWKDLHFLVSPTNFKHTGVFPEQAVNWDYIFETIKSEVSSGHEIKALNMFAYTGGATLAAAMAGAKVTHVDASKGMTGWAKENAKSSGLAEAPIRWLIDDCVKFVEREIRRGNKYQVIIMDPPSYGRGPKGELWKMEDGIYNLIRLTNEILADDAVLFLINMYTTGLSPAVLNYMISSTIIKNHGGEVESSDVGLPVRDTGLILPCGCTARWTK